MHGQRGRLGLTLGLATAAFVLLAAGTAFATAFTTGPYNTDDNYLHAKAVPAISYHTFVVNPYDESKSDYVDWAKFTVTATDTPVVIEAQSSGAALTDVYLDVYDSNGSSVLASNDDNGYWDYTLSSSIFFRAPHKGTFYVRLEDDDDQNGSCYLYLNKGIARRIGSGSNASVAAAASQLQYSDTTNPEMGTGEGPDSIVVCNSSIPADVIAAGVLANRLDTTVLFTDKNSLPSATASEINRVLMSYIWDDEYTTAYVMGGTNSVSNATVAKIAKLTNVYQVRRVKASSVASLLSYIAQGGGGVSGTWWSSTTSSGRVILVNTANTVDGLLASTLAHDGWATVLSVTKSSVPASTQAFLSAYSPSEIYIMGGTNSVSTAVDTWLATNYAGATRTRLRSTTTGGTIYDLARWVADWGVSNGRFTRGSAILVSGSAAVDAAPAVSMSRQMGRPVLFTPKTSLSSLVKSYVDGSVHGADLSGVSYVLGGTNVLTASTFNAFCLHYTAPLP